MRQIIVSNLRAALHFVLQHCAILPFLRGIQIVFEATRTAFLLAVSPPKPVPIISAAIKKLPITVLLPATQLPAVVRPVLVEAVPDPCDRSGISKPPQTAEIGASNDRKAQRSSALRFCSPRKGHHVLVGRSRGAGVDHAFGEEKTDFRLIHCAERRRVDVLIWVIAVRLGGGRGAGLDLEGRICICVRSAV